MIAIAFGLTSAVAWGAADFTGGLASRRTGAYQAVFYGELIGQVVIIAVALASPQAAVTVPEWLVAMAAGALGTGGLLLLYHAMTKGLMSIATPVSALLAAVIPVIAGSILEKPPEALVVLGFVFALAAVWLISRGEDSSTSLLAHIADLKLPLLAGIGFGLYFILLHSATRTAVLWPMVAARTGGVIIMGLYILLTRRSWVPQRSAYGMMLLNGLLDISGNLFFVLAGQAGRLDIAAVLSSLYPGSTVVLAGVFLRERLTRTQWMGIFAALVAIVLFSV